MWSEILNTASTIVHIKYIIKIILSHKLRLVVLSADMINLLMHRQPNILLACPIQLQYGI